VGVHEVGMLLALAGFGLLVVNTLGRRRARKTGAPVSWWLRWGDFVALGIVAAGLYLMR
jgi:hypothetical protein